MKLLLIGLCILPMTILAQENHREATPEERKFILPTEEEKRMKELGVEASKEAERNIMNKALLRQALVKGKLDDAQIKSYIQKLTDQGLNQKQIKAEIENLSNNYFAELQIKNLEKVLSPEKQKQYEQKFTELQKRYEEEKLSHEELDKEISILDAEISQSTATKENEVKLAEFKRSFLTMEQDNTFVKKPYVFDPKHFEPIKVMVPKNFNLNPLCLDQSGASHSAQLDLLNEQMKSITTSGEVKNKPFIHEIYFAWGYNRNYHSNTDVKFTTADGTFTEWPSKR
jgi:hypothetical protein